MKKLSLCSLFLGTLMVLTPHAHAAGFTDVSNDDPHAAGIKYVYDQGIVQGYNDGTFKSTSRINRAEFSKIIINAFLKTDVDITATCYYNYSTALKSCSNSSSCEATEFGKFAVCTNKKSDANGQWAADALALKGYGNCFADVKVDDWFHKYICLAKVRFVVDGYSNGSFLPSNEITFAEAAKIIVNSVGYAVVKDEKIWYKPYVTSLIERHAIPKTIVRFDQKITRGEMADIVYRLLDKKMDLPSQTYDDLR